MCEYCATFGRHDLSVNDIIMTTPAQYTYIGDYGNYYMPMIYCPNCGRKLIEEENK